MNTLLNLYHDDHKSTSLIVHWSASPMRFFPQGSRLLLLITLFSHNRQWYPSVTPSEMHLTDVHKTQSMKSYTCPCDRHLKRIFEIAIMPINNEQYLS